MSTVRRSMIAAVAIAALIGAGSLSTAWAQGEWTAPADAKNTKNPEAAWQFIKYLTTNTDAVVKLANGIKNIPTLNSALKSSALKVDDKFKVFIDISSNAKTSTTPPSGSGSAYQQAMQKFCQDWQAGSVKDLAGGLKKLDTDINQQLALGG